MAYTLIHNGSLGKYIGITHYDCLGKSQLNLAELWTLGSGCLIVICTNEIDFLINKKRKYWYYCSSIPRKKRLKLTTSSWFQYLDERWLLTTYHVGLIWNLFFVLSFL